MTHPYEDPSLPLQRRAQDLLARSTSRKAQKQLGAWLDASAQGALKAAVLDIALRSGVDLPEEAALWPGKRLLRRALGRESAARVRKNPIARDESFECQNCGRHVPIHGRTARDHCPYCLYSLHVDVVPGDRAEDCGGLLKPERLEQRDGKLIIHYRCVRCGAERRNRALTDGDPPDDWQALVDLGSREAP